jgi:hypothetical protein
MPEGLLSRLEVNPKGQLIAGIRNLGTITFPDWKNTFTAKCGRKKEQKGFWKREELHNRLCEIFSSSYVARMLREKCKDWRVLQFLLSIEDRDLLPEEFIRGNYTKSARFFLKAPWHVLDLPDYVSTGLRARQELESLVENLESAVRSLRTKGYASRTLNQLDSLFAEYDGTNFEEVMRSGLENRVLRQLPEDVFERRREISDRLQITNSSLAEKARLNYRIEKRKGGTSRRIDFEAKDWDFLKEGRMITREEIYKQGICFLDIEIPFFRRKDARISWVGAGFVKEGKVDYRIYTLYDLGSSEIDGFKVKTFKTEEELVEALSRDIKNENPAAVSAHNHKFDLTKLRESAAGFPIGEDETPPLYKVTTPFFERLGVRDRLVIDTMHWQRIARKYDLNAKFEMTAGVKKSITYDEMERLEDKALAGDKEAARRIAEYLTGDIKPAVENVLLSDEFKNSLDDVLFLAETFNVSPERLMHSAKCINEAQEAEYFRELGIYRDEIPPNQRTTVMEKRREKARDTFMKRVVEEKVKHEDKKGLFDGAYKVYIPFGDFLREAIVRRFPKAKELYDYIDKHRDDKKRLFFLEQYSAAISEWLREGYGQYIVYKRELVKNLRNIAPFDFEKIYDRIKGKFESSSELHAHYEKLMEATICLRDMKKGLDVVIRDFMDKQGIDDRKLLELIHKRVKVGRSARWIIGNFDVFPKRKYYSSGGWNRDEREVVDLEKLLKGGFEEVNRFIEEAGLEIIAQEGAYLYVKPREDKDREIRDKAEQALTREDAPLVLVDRIPILYNSDNPYYTKLGYWSHMKVKDTPDFRLSVFEMDNFGKILSLILAGNTGEAMKTYSSSREDLEHNRVNPERLVFQNKSKGYYFVFSTLNEKDEQGKLYFLEPGEVPEDADIIEEHGKRYFLPGRLEEKRKKIEHDEKPRLNKKGEPIPEKRVYIMTREEVFANIDRQKYFEKFQTRGRAILAALSRTGRLKKQKYRPNELVLGLN